MATSELVYDLLGPTSTDDERRRGWLARAAKLTGLAVGSLVLCGSVVAASTLAHHRPVQPGAVPPSAPITGAGALRPDTLSTQLSGGQSTANTGHRKAAPPMALGSGKTATGAIVGKPPPQSHQDAGAPMPMPLTAVDVVRDFYRLLGSQPAEAALLVDPSLLASDPTGFTQSWSSVSDVRIESLHANPDGTVQAVIRMLQPDGSWVRLVELLHVTLGNDPVISGAELLSAQHG